MTKIKTGFNQLTSGEMKEIKGGVLVLMPKWLCDAGGGDFYEVCYAVQPQTPCAYATPCVQIAECPSDSPELCPH